MHGFEKFREFLTDEGYRIMDDQETFYVFKHEGTSFFVFKHKSPYVQLAMPLGVGDTDRSRLLEVCNEMNDNCMVVKFVVRADHVLANFEFAMFDNTPHDFLEAVMPYLDNVTDDFFECLGGKNKD